MGYKEAWKVLENLVAEFRKEGISISSETMHDLRSAKTMMQMLKADASRLEFLPTIGAYLDTVESQLMGLALEKFGQAFVEQWMKKLDEARRKVEEEKVESTFSKLALGIQRSDFWVRVLPSEDILKETVENLAGEIGVSCKMQEDGYILVYGSKEKIKEFVKKMRV